MEHSSKLEFQIRNSGSQEYWLGNPHSWLAMERIKAGPPYDMMFDIANQMYWLKKKKKKMFKKLQYICIYIYLN